jgi:hypothetical protein
MQKYTEDNEKRSTEMVTFLINEAIKAGVLTKKIKRTAHNPNKWEKHLAPWFTGRCREARTRYKTAVKRNGKLHTHTTHALKRYVQACKDGRAQM